MEQAPLARICHARHFLTHDGVSLVYKHWPAISPPPERRAIVLFHRGHEHSARIAHLVDELDLPECDFFAWDARGHGQSPGARGHSPSFATSVHDVHTFIQHIVAKHGIAEEQIAVIAQSVGAVLAAAWVHDYGPKIQSLVLASPAFRIKLYVPFARFGLTLARAVRGNFFINSYVKPRFLTHDTARVASYQSDPLIARAISVDVLLGLYEASERVVADAQAIQVPTQLLISGSDVVVHRAPQERFFDNLGAAVKEQHLLPGFFHDTLGERDRAIAMSRIRRFILSQYDQPASRRSLLDADRVGASCAEAEALAMPLPRHSLANAYWRATRAALKVGARLSSGLALGFETGFDSGSTLDYVYRNTPQGRTVLGRVIDRVYLNSIGWRGIRARRDNVETLLRASIVALQQAGQPVHIVDAAAGHGRYVLDTVASLNHKPDSILLRDYSDLNVEHGQALIQARGFGNIARFVKGDAFDAADLAAIAPRPTLAIVSGLYELFGDNTLVGRSLAGLADAVAPGGYLVYTGQPWHPQLEMIARALTSHRDGAAWVMRRRSQAEMDELVASAGFTKVTQRIDEHGIFTVSLARRRG